MNSAFRKLALFPTTCSEAGLLLAAPFRQMIAGHSPLNITRFFYAPTIAGRNEMRCYKNSKVCLYRWPLSRPNRWTKLTGPYNSGLRRDWVGRIKPSEFRKPTPCSRIYPGCLDLNCTQQLDTLHRPKEATGARRQPVNRTSTVAPAA